jgi:hypothetical protein
MLATAIQRNLLTRKDLSVIGISAAVYIVFVLIRDLFINELGGDFLLSDIVFFFKYVLLAYAYVMLLREKTITYLVDVIVHLTLVSFIFYFFQIIGFKDQLFDFSRSLTFNSGFNPLEGVDGYTNFIIFALTVGRHDYANSGFLWEPGAFGCFLILALLFNLFKNKFRYEGKSTILIIGILTTISTTNYIALIIVLFILYRVRVPKLNKWFFALVLLPIAIALLFILPIFGDKILYVYNSDMLDLTRLKTLEKYYHKQHAQIPLNRFASIEFVYDTFGPKLILGVSNKYDVILNKKNDVNISNGIPDFVARFGILWLIFLFYRFLKFCSLYLPKAELLIYCGLVLFVMSFGEPILILPICLIFLFLPLIKLESEEKGSDKYTRRGMPQPY